MIAQIGGGMDLGTITDMIRPQLLALASAFAVVLQVIRVGVLRIRAADKMPEPLRYTFMALCFAWGYALAYSALEFFPAETLVETAPVQGTLMGAVSLGTYMGLSKLFGTKQTPSE